MPYIRDKVLEKAIDEAARKVVIQNRFNKNKLRYNNNCLEMIYSQMQNMHLENFYGEFDPFTLGQPIFNFNLPVIKESLFDYESEEEILNDILKPRILQKGKDKIYFKTILEGNK